MIRSFGESKEKMKIKGKYKGNKNVKLEIEPNLPIGADVFIETGPENIEEKKLESLSKKKADDNEEHFLLKIARLAKPANRTDYSETYHEILYGIE